MLLIRLIIVVIFVLALAGCRYQKEGDILASDNKSQELIKQLTNGDRSVLGEIEKVGLDAFEPLSEALLNSTSAEEKWLVLHALAKNPNVKSIQIFATQKFSDNESTSGEFTSFIDNYLFMNTGREFESLEGFESWYSKNADSLVWSGTDKKFFKSSGAQ